MIVGRLFTYLGQRYEPGADFDINGIAESRRSSFIRLYGLGERSAPTKKKKKMAKLVDEVIATAKAAAEAPPLIKKNVTVSSGVYRDGELQADEAAASAVLKDITEEPPTGGVQGEDLNG